MNELQHHRVAQELRDAARDVDLAPGSARDVVAAGVRRMRRRRQAGAFALVAALGGGTALVVQRLASTDESMIQMDQPDGPTTTGDGEPAAPDATTTTTTTTVAAVPVATLASSAGDAAVDAVPAEATASNVVWRVVEPDATEAVGLVEWNGGVAGSVSPVPGVHLATAPGRSNDFRWQFWRSDDGVTWRTVDIDLPFGNPNNVRVDGSKVYQVGTAPGVAATEPNPLLLAVSDDDGTTWEQLELPVDTNEGRSAPFIAGAGVQAEVYPDDEGAIVLVRRSPNPDWPALMEAAGVDPQDSLVFEPRPDGVVMPVDRECRPGGGGDPTTTVVFPAFPTAASEPTVTAPDGTPTEVGGCALEVVPWAELGIPQETADVLSAGRDVRVFRLTDTDPTELDVPVGVVNAWWEGDRLAFSDEAGNRYQLVDDRLVDDDSDADIPAGWEVGANATTSFQLAGLDTSPFFSAGVQQAYGAQPIAGGPVQWADWSAVLGEGRIRQDHITGVTNLGLIVAGNTFEDPYVAAGGQEVSVDGFTIRRTSAYDAVEVIDESTGAPVDPAVIGVGPENELVIGDGAGGERARIPVDTEEMAMLVWGGYLEEQADRNWFVATSTDAVHVAVESLSELLGVDDADIRTVNRISTDGIQTVLAVSLNQTRDDGSYRQLVLIGTPAT